MNIHPATVTASGLEGVGWVKSSYSNGGGNCVEVGHGRTHAVPVRDSKNPGPVLNFPVDAFTSFVTGIKTGQFKTA
ncbi:DUF397 domain-containing protein [Streptomyces sp. NPDC087850]|uniref:DUF397 domain-containing protein n=1 Tax=Streptomyces sp. NPDC087850 TaxID=3365809 RepID=UPI0038068B7C